MNNALERTARNVLVGIAGFLVAGPASSIVMRHDVDPHEYINLAKTLPQPLIVLRTSTGTVNGIGTWVSEGWILTAAHIARSLNAGGKIGNSGELTVVAIEIHPDFSDSYLDVALIKVDSTSEDAEIVPICGQAAEIGLPVTFVGAGDTGDGLSGPDRGDGRMRAAQNTIVGIEGHRLVFIFDAPSSESVRPMEGISGPGDSGGPAYLQVAGGVCVIGVSSGQDTRPTGGAEGRYGVREYYMRVGAYVDWVQEILSAHSE